MTNSHSRKLRLRKNRILLSVGIIDKMYRERHFKGIVCIKNVKDEKVFLVINGKCMYSCCRCPNGKTE